MSTDIHGLPASLLEVEALVFDQFGTCTDWFTPVYSSLVAHASKSPSLKDVPDSKWAEFAHLWRAAYFALTGKVGQSEMDFIPLQEGFRQTLRDILLHKNITEWGEDVQADLANSWTMCGVWKDTVAGLEALRSKYILIALTNGSAESLVKTNRRNGTNFDFLLASDIVGTYKPNAKMYNTALKAAGKLESPGSVAMVAAHVHDLEAAAKCGLKTIYVKRATDDMDINLQDWKFDLVISEGGFVELARRLGIGM